MSKKDNGPLRVVELFAGVGGFRLGLEGYDGKSPISGYKEPMENDFKVVWSNQWEPSTPKRQHANEVYNARWEDSKNNHNGENIEDVIKEVTKSMNVDVVSVRLAIQLQPKLRNLIETVFCDAK